MAVTVMLATKERRDGEPGLINSGGLGSMKTLTKWSKTVDGVSSMEGGREKKALMVPMMVTSPLQLVHLDFTSFEMTTNLNESPKVEHVLVIMDHFTQDIPGLMLQKIRRHRLLQRPSIKGSSLFLEHPKEYSQTKEKPSQMRSWSNFAHSLG